MRNFLLFALDADGNTNVALLVVALDHNAYIRPVAVLVHRDTIIRVNMLRDFLQHSVQKSILIIIPGGDGNDPVISHLFRMEIERSSSSQQS